MALYWGWVVCLCFLLLFTISAGIAFSFGEMIVPIGKEVHASVSLLAWVGALPSSLPMIFATLTTWIDGRFGTRRVVLAGVCVATVSLAAMALAPSGVVLLTLGVGGLLTGIGILLIVNPPFYLLDEYFPYEHPRHVLATSLTACGFPLATMIFNPLIYSMIEASGWRSCYCAFAIMMFVIGTATALTFRPCSPEERAREMLLSTAPEAPASSSASSSLKNPSGNSATSSVPYVKVQGVDDGEPVEERSPSTDAGRNVPTPTAAKVVLGLIWFTSSTIKSMGYYTPIATLVKQMDTLGIPQSQSSAAMTLIGSCEVVSRLVTSYFGDRFKGKILYMYCVCTLAMCIQNAFGSLAVTYTHLLIYAAAQGFCGGPILAAMYSSCSEVLGGQHVPMLFSIFRTGLGIGGLLGPTIAGAIYDATGSFRLAFYLNCILYAITSGLYLSVIVLNRKRPKCLFQTDPPDPSSSFRDTTATTTTTTDSSVEERGNTEETVLYDRKADYASITSTNPIANGLSQH